MKTITEHDTKIAVELPKGVVTKRMGVFYNPIMVSNRNISVTLLNSLSKKKLKISLPVAGTGIRALRFLKELKKGKIETLFVNDLKEDFKKTFKKNLELNDLTPKNVEIYNEEASQFLLQADGCDYIELDPFGSPNNFLAASVAAISKGGILAVTATDTAALTGTYPKVTKRKYWARNVKNYLMHELGLRILIRKVQLQGIQFDKVFIPILSYHKDHYFRIYFVCEKGKQKCDAIIKEHQYLLYNAKTLEFKTSNYNKEEEFDFIGPLWVGNLKDQKFVTKMAKNNTFEEDQKFLELLANEKDIFGFYDLHQLSRKYQTQTPKIEPFLKKLHGTRTHFSLHGVKTTKSLKEVLTLLKK